jgi:hypothetical protein
VKERFDKIDTITLSIVGVSLVLLALVMIAMVDMLPPRLLAY